MSKISSSGKSASVVKVDVLARVEGEGALYIKLKNERIEDLKLKIPEPPRLFEAFLRGRHFDDAPDITARICGICPIAYQMSSVHAIENALGVEIDPRVRALRRLLYCGEWIESHVLHAFLLHAPDFLGYEDAFQLAADYREAVVEALRLKKIGNAIVSLIGGREIHPVSVRAGGFHKTPRVDAVRALLPDLEWAREAACRLARLTASFPFPEFEPEHEYVSLAHPDEYPMNEGRLVSSRGLDLVAAEYEDHFTEIHVRHSNALHSQLRERGSYHCGPLARFNLNFALLPERVREVAAELRLTPPVKNPFRSIVVRMLETAFAVEEAWRIAGIWEPPARSFVRPMPRASTGHAITEAPRGILYHRYTLDAEGLILACRIVPPTSQNLKRMEDDLWQLAPASLSLPLEQLTLRCEHAIRNYDPCISCATHFLKVSVECAS